MRINVKLLDGETLEFHVRENSCTIGRSAKCNVVIPHDGVSRQHCQLDIENGEVFVTDLASTNGVLIDGTRIEPNKKTKFQTYLPLSFGPVQSLMVDLEEDGGIPTSFENPIIRNASTEDSSARTQMMTRVAPVKPKPATPSSSLPPPRNLLRKKKDNTKMKLILASIFAILIVALAWYMETNKEETSGSETKSTTIKYY
jgi:pSer/pThr/pTyr-binding forkhead associated (FHA) protein